MDTAGDIACKQCGYHVHAPTCPALVPGDFDACAKCLKTRAGEPHCPACPVGEPERAIVAVNPCTSVCLECGESVSGFHDCRRAPQP